MKRSFGILGLLTLLSAIAFWSLSANSGSNTYELNNHYSYSGIAATGQQNPRKTVITPAEPIFGATDSTPLWDWANRSALLTVVGDDGTISVMDRLNAIVYEFSYEMELTRTLHFDKPLAEIGAFTRDDAGNFFVFYAQDAEEGDYTKQNMVLVKYSPAGVMLMDYWLEAQTSDERWGAGYSGVMLPFRAGTARVEISGDMIAVYFARIMFNSGNDSNRQASWGFILDVNTFERLTDGTNMTIPSSSYSFNQFILPAEDGFVFASHGHTTPHSFSFTRVTRGHSNRILNSFRFQDSSYDEFFTGAEMGQLAHTPTGFIFSGAWNQGAYSFLAPRNLFLLTFDADMTRISDPIWITHHTYDDIHVLDPQIIQIGTARYLLLWGETALDMTTFSWSRRVFKAIVDDQGNIITPAQEIEGVRLNGNDVLRFCSVTRRVYWAILDSWGDIILYGLDPATGISHAPDIYFTVIFDPGPGCLGDFSGIQRHTYGSLILHMPLPTHPEYNFYGWLLDGEAVPPQITVRENMTLTASWTPITGGQMPILPPITFPIVLPGDVNGDGAISAADVGLLRAYLAGFPVEIVHENADITGTGTITAADLGILRAYLAGFDVILGPQP